MPASVSLLRDQMRRLAATARPARRVSLGAKDMDEALSGGLKLGALHEVYAASSTEAGAATGFTLGLAMRAAAGAPLLWARQDMLDIETGQIYAPGLMELGIKPQTVVLVRGRHANDVLKAGEDAVRCAGLGAVIIEPWGDPSLLDLTASRRLVLAATASGVTVLMLRVGASPSPSAADTRWHVGAAPSRRLEADAPGLPAFSVKLLRQRGGDAGQAWLVEWDRDRLSFVARDERATAPLSCPVVCVPADRTAGEVLRRTG